MIFLFEAILALPLIATLVLCGGVVAFFGAIYTFKARHAVSFVWTLVALAAIVFAFFPWVASLGSSYMVDGQPNLRAIGVTLLELGAVWLVGGAVAAVAYWWSFVRDVRNRFIEQLDAVKQRVAVNDNQYKDWSPRSLALVTKAVALGSKHDNVFLEYGFELPLPSSVTGHNHSSEFLTDSMRDTWNAKGAPEKSAAKDLVAKVTGSAAEPAFEPSKEEERAERNLDRLETALNTVLPPKAKFFKARISYAAAVWPITLVSLLLSDLIRHLVDTVFEYFRGFLDMVSKSAFGDFNANKA